MFELMAYGLVYTLGWLVLYIALNLLKGHHLFRSPFQRNNWLSCIYYIISTPLLVASFFVDPPPFGYEIRPTPMLLHVILIIFSFYAFATLQILIVDKSKDKMVLVHHIAFGFVLLILLYWQDFPRFWMWLYLTQAPGLLFHALLAMRKSDKISPAFLLGLEKVHLWAFFFFRIFVHIIFCLFCIYYDVTGHYHPIYVFWCLGLPIFLLTTYLNIVWAKKAVDHFKQEQLKLLRHQSS